MYHTQNQQIEIVEKLIAEGWEFKAHSFTPKTTGWWVLPNSDDPVKKMRRGDPKPFHQGAVATAELYTNILEA